LLPALALTGASGFRLGGKWKHRAVAAKKKRMPIIVLNGLLVLATCALTLRQLALSDDFGTAFHVVQAVELCAGAVNIALMGLSFRDGLRLKRRIPT